MPQSIEVAFVVPMGENKAMIVSQDGQFFHCRTDETDFNFLYIKKLTLIEEPEVEVS